MCLKNANLELQYEFIKFSCRSVGTRAQMCTSLLTRQLAEIFQMGFLDQKLSIFDSCCYTFYSSHMLKGHI